MPNNIISKNLIGSNPNMVSVKPESVYGYEIRKPFSGEDAFFKSRPEVGGMAAEDGKIVLNPYSPLKDQEKAQVAKNEAIRLWMKDNKPKIQFDVNDKQMQSFAGTEYGSNPQALKETIVARILTGDPSAQASKDQVAAANEIMRKITQSIQKPTISESIMSAMNMKNTKSK
jgi:hypothetical protein